MADFTALKLAIQTYIKQNGNEEITGERLQEILLSMVTTLGDSAINDLVTALANEVAARQNADGTLQQNITNEATARGNADTALGGRIDDEETARANGDTALSNRLGSTITAENTAADQIGAEAEARAAADTALQGLIDGITHNIANGYVYAGIATPSSTPTTGKVFYLALIAGTYTYFLDSNQHPLEITRQGINILKYDGNSWSIERVVLIDGIATADSHALVESGGIFSADFSNRKSSMMAKCMSANLEKADYKFVGNRIINKERFLIGIVFDDNTKFVGFVPAFDLDIFNQNDYVSGESVWDGADANGYLCIVVERPHDRQSIFIENVKLSGCNFAGAFNNDDWVVICTLRVKANGERHIVKDVAPINNADDILEIPEISQSVFISDETIILTSISDYGTNGYITESGSFVETGSPYTICSPINVEGYKYIVIKDGGTLGVGVNYVNCYENNDFTGFLGRSNALPYASLAFSEEYVGKAMILPVGTKYITFMTVGQHGRVLSTNITIAGGNLCRNGYKFKDTNVQLSFKREYSATPIRFTIPVNCHMANDSNTLLLQDEKETYYDWGVLILPESYSPSGEPVPLVISCHGAGGNVSATSSQMEQQAITKYLVANGFAVMDMNGLPEEYATLESIDLNNNVGNPFGVQSYINGWKYVSEFYNVMEFPLIMGGSMGGLMGINIVQNGSVKPLAHAIGCPVTDTYNQAFLNPWSGGLPKTALGKIYGFAQDGGTYVYSEDKLKGYNPITNGLFTFDTEGKLVSSIGAYDYTTQKLNGESVVEYKKYPCPLKIWHCQDDPTVNYGGSVRFVNSIRNAGGDAQLRSLPSGLHNPFGAGDPISNPSGNTVYKGTDISSLITPVIEEIYLFFNRYSSLNN